MSVKIRMSRHGAKKRPFYHIVAASSRDARDGKYLEKLGTYNPMLEKDNPERVKLNEERIKYWLSVGAIASDRVARFLGEAKLIEMPKWGESPLKSAPKKKAQDRAKQNAEKAAKAAAAETSAA